MLTCKPWKYMSAKLALNTRTASEPAPRSSGLFASYVPDLWP
jgi:hypothetical protein